MSATETEDISSLPFKEQIENGHSRRMSDLENYFAIMQRQRLYKNFAVIGTFNKDIKSDTSKLAQALKSILFRYPILCTTIVDTDYSDLSVLRPIHDYVKVLDTIKLSDILMELPKECTESDSMEIKCRFINDIELPYGNGHSVWKLAFLDTHTCAYISNHVLADGINGVHFMEDLKTELNKLDQLELEFEIIDSKDPIILDYSKNKDLIPKLPPPFTDIVDYTPPSNYLLQFLFKRFLIDTFCYQNATPDKTEKQRYKIFNIPPKDLDLIKKSLAKNSRNPLSKVTLTPYMQMVWLKNLYDNVLSKKTWLGCTDILLPCNARQFIPHDIEDKDRFRYGWHTSGIQDIHRPVKNLTWKVINDQHDYLKECLKNRTYLHQPGMMTLKKLTSTRNMDQFVIDRNLMTRRGGSTFSNVGLLSHGHETPDQSSDDGLTDNSDSDGNNQNAVNIAEKTGKKTDPYELVDGIFTQNLSNGSYTFGVFTASTKTNGMNVVMTAPESVIEQKDFELLASDFRKLLLSHETFE